MNTISQQNSIWCLSLPQDQGTLISQFQLCTEDKKNSYHLKITSKMIIFNEKYIPYSFDLKFTIIQQKLTFFLNQKSVSFIILNEEQQKIRDLLKQFIRQKGFHEQFKAIKKIGQGSFAYVYHVKKISTGQDFAAKAFLKQRLNEQQKGRQCLLKEIQIMRKLKSPHNMKLYEIFQSQNSFYLVFQYLKGGILLDKIKSKNKCQPKQTKNMVYGILKGLRLMHSKGIMHRDLKPENILLRNQSQCVIADYGLAQFVDNDKYLYSRCGTPGYVAPQVINMTDMSMKYSSVCDMFSLGIIFYYLLFQKSLFKGKNYNQVLRENKECKFNFDDEKYKKLPQKTFDLLQKLLKIDPKERITSEQALNHPYFKDLDSQQTEIQDNFNDLKQSSKLQNKKISIISTDIQSPDFSKQNNQKDQNMLNKRQQNIFYRCDRQKQQKLMQLRIQNKTQNIFGCEKQSDKIKKLFGNQLLKGFDVTKIQKKFSQTSNIQHQQIKI